nr:asparaginase [Deltaproteobacteria bacterium]
MRLLMLHTGGTLMMRGGDPTPLVPDVYTSDLLTELPVLNRIADIETRILFNYDSSDMQPHHWVELGAAVHGALDERRADGSRAFDGVVVLHGTDTMAYTASALAFLLRGLDRPVVLTGAQRPLAEVRTDARSNLVDACHLATMDIPEVGIGFNAKLLRGCRAVKMDAWGLDAFGSPSCPPLVTLGVTVERGSHACSRRDPPGLRRAHRARCSRCVSSPGSTRSSCWERCGRAFGAWCWRASARGTSPASRTRWCPWCRTPSPGTSRW